jgi:hypothetical protein
LGERLFNGLKEEDRGKRPADLAGVPVKRLRQMAAAAGVRQTRTMRRAELLAALTPK